MSSIPFQLDPHHGVNPNTEKSDWPSKENGFPSYEARVKQWTGAAYEEAIYEHSQNDEIQAVPKQIDYILGKQCLSVVLPTDLPL